VSVHGVLKPGEVDPARAIARLGEQARRLTPAQLRVLRRLAAGDSVREAAASLGMSRTAVRNALDKAQDHLDARTPAHAVANAIRLCVID
jgi:DNA-binding CsgD family transcriptional regulator